MAKEQAELIKTLQQKIAAQQDPKINALDEKGCTYLHNACQAQNFSLVNFLVRAKADVNVKSKAGLTPLDQARKDNNQDVALLLSGYKATATKLQPVPLLCELPFEQRIQMFGANNPAARQQFRAGFDRDQAKKKQLMAL